MDSLYKLRQKQKNPSKCEICDKEFKSNNGLKKHFNMVHMLMKEHQCHICDISYFDEQFSCDNSSDIEA